MINDLKSRTSSGVSITSCIHPVIQLWNLGSVIAEQESFETMHFRKMFSILYKEQDEQIHEVPHQDACGSFWHHFYQKLETRFKHVYKNDTHYANYSQWWMELSSSDINNWTGISWLYFLLTADKRMSWM